MNKQNKGFTLVELIVVIAILAILSVALIPLVNNLIDKSRISRALSDVQAMRTGMVTLKADTGTLEPRDSWNGPILLENTQLLTNSQNLAAWQGPYVESGTLHPWGGSYFFVCNDVDKLPPTEGRIFDITAVLSVSNTSGDTVVIPQTLVVEEVNQKLVGDKTGGDNPKSVAGGNGAVEIVVFSNAVN